MTILLGIGTLLALALLFLAIAAWRRNGLDGLLYLASAHTQAWADSVRAAKREYAVKRPQYTAWARAEVEG